MSDDRIPTLIELNDSTAERTVFCVHTVGGGLGAYKHLAEKLADTARFCGLEDPSIYANETFASVPELAELHVETIARVQPRGPYLLFGACSAGPIAYEIACHLDLLGEPVERVVMFGAQSDLVAYDPAFKDSYAFLRAYLSDSLGLDDGGMAWDSLVALDRRSACSAIVEALMAHNEPLRGVGADVLGDKIASMLMTQAATRRYRAPKSSLDIDLFVHPTDGNREAHDFRSWCDWNDLSDGSIEHIDIPRRPDAGSGVLSAPYVDAVAERLRQTIFRHGGTAAASPEKRQA